MKTYSRGDASPGRRRGLRGHGHLVALAIRNDGDEPAPERSSLPEDLNPYEVFDDDSVSVLCAEEVRQMCEELEYVVSDTRAGSAWVTATRLATVGPSAPTPG